MDRSPQQLIEILRAFQSVTQMIAEYEEDVDKLLQAILHLTVSALDVPYASILLLDSKRRKFHTIATYGSFPLSLDLRAIADVSKLTECPAATGQRLVMAEFIEESEWDRLEPNERLKLGQVFCSPLTIKKEIIGVSCVYGVDFEPNALESEVFCTLSVLAALSIEKSLTYNRVQKSLEATRGELRKAQGELIRSEKLSSLAEIAMSIGHSIRNPVTVIGGLTQRMMRSMPQDDPKRAWSAMILEETSRLERIVNEYKRFFLIKQIAFRNEDINSVAAKALEDFKAHCRPEHQVRFIERFSNEPLICRVDPDLLRRCIIHLLSNAFESATATMVHITLVTSRRDSEAFIDVMDSGKGMSRKEMNHIFDPFYSTKTHGAGMGLTFVHFVISEHSGGVEMNSERGVGSRFRIKLPLTAAV